MLWWCSKVESRNGKWIRLSEIHMLYVELMLHWKCLEVLALMTILTYKGIWNWQEAIYHTNYLQLLIIWYSLQSVHRCSKNIHIENLIQYTQWLLTKYVNDFGGIQSLLIDDELASRIWRWCTDRNIQISAVHPGKDNTAVEMDAQKKII